MKELNKKNLEDFLNYYHYLHDSYINSINYDIDKMQIDILINVYWSGEPILKEDNTYETNKVKMKMIFEGIENYINKEIYSYDYIDNAIFKYIKKENKEFICFMTDEDDPYFYVVCDKIKYEEL